MSELRTYHGQPVLKQPTWSWEIPCYFFTGGLAGASAGLAYLAELRGNDVLGRRAWALSITGIAVSSPLLISDLGRPTRFLNMLRMFKITSPMSVGSWILSASSATTTLAAVNAWTGRFPRSAKLAKPAAALLGLPLSSYTAALVGNTAVPVWHESHRMLPFMFVSGAALSAGGGALVITPPRHAGAARRLALASAAGEGLANELLRLRLGELGEPYKRGSAARFGLISRGCVLAGSGLLARRGSSSKTAAATAGVLLLAGALSARWSVFRAGVQSAADPKYVVGPQRQRIERGLARGGSRRESRVSAPIGQTGSPATAPATG